jgi:glutaconate CoA-transferase subunit A
MAARLVTLWESVAGIPDGASVALGRPGALALVGELVRQGREGLHLVGVPTGGRAVELLVAAGCARSIETSGVDLGEEGLAPAFGAAVESGALRVLDSSCPALLMALQAGASGVSFTPVPGLLGTDLLRRRPDFREIDDPFRPGGRVVLVPAVAPEFALLHGRRADRDGNVVISAQFDDRLVAQASGHVVYSVDALCDDAATGLGAGEQVVPAALVDALVLVSD